MTAQAVTIFFLYIRLVVKLTKLTAVIQLIIFFILYSNCFIIFYYTAYAFLLFFPTLKTTINTVVWPSLVFFICSAIKNCLTTIFLPIYSIVYININGFAMERLNYMAGFTKILFFTYLCTLLLKVLIIRPVDYAFKGATFKPDGYSFNFYKLTRLQRRILKELQDGKVLKNVCLHYCLLYTYELFLLSKFLKCRFVKRSNKNFQTKFKGLKANIYCPYRKKRWRWRRLLKKF